MKASIADGPLMISYQGLDLYGFNLLAREWNLDFTQLMPGSLSVDLSQVMDGEIQLGYAKLNADARQEGFSPQGAWSFAFVKATKIFWRNFFVQPESIIVYAPGSRVNAVSSDDFEVMTFSITENSLLQWANENNCSGVIDQLYSTEVIQTKGQEWHLLRNLIFENIEEYQNEKKKDVKSLFLGGFLDRLFQLIQNSHKSTKKVSSIRRLELLTNVEALMVKSFRESITVQELAKQFNVSERTLLYTFKNRYDVGPKLFSKTLKLNMVYQELRGDSGKSIASVARECGFWHMGQFHKDYKDFFGELPSETLKKKH